MLKEKVGILLDFSKPDHARWKILLEYHAHEKHETDIQILEQILKNEPNAIIRHDAAFALSYFNTPIARTILVNAAMEDKNPLVRHEIAEALSFHPLTLTTKKALEHLLEDSIKEVRETARMVLLMKIQKPKL